MIPGRCPYLTAWACRPIGAYTPPGDVSLSEAAKLPIDKDDGGDGVSVEDMRPTGHELTCLRVGAESPFLVLQRAYYDKHALFAGLFDPPSQ
jgi:hypothetical protein